MFERLRDALRAALDAATPPRDLRDLVRQMREAVVEAKLAVADTREATARAERELAAERQRLADAERRGRLAAEIQDAETVEVAHRFAAKHRDRVGVLEHKWSPRPNVPRSVPGAICKRREARGPARTSERSCSRPSWTARRGKPRRTAS